MQNAIDEKILRALKDENQDDVREYLDEVHDYGEYEAYTNDSDDEDIRHDFYEYLDARS